MVILSYFVPNRLLRQEQGIVTTNFQFLPATTLFSCQRLREKMLRFITFQQNSQKIKSVSMNDILTLFRGKRKRLFFVISRLIVIGTIGRFIVIGSRCRRKRRHCTGIRGILDFLFNGRIIGIIPLVHGNG